MKQFYLAEIVTKDKLVHQGFVRKPKGKGPFPAVIFVPGLGMTMHEYNRSFDEIAKKLNQAGILTLQFQFDIFKPDGSVRELPLDARAKQFTKALDWLLARPDVDPKRVGILAQSYGVPTILSADVSLAKSLVFIGGAYFPWQSITRVYAELNVAINYEGDTTLPKTSGEYTTVGKEFWLSVKSFDPIAPAKKVTQPILMIHGDHDTKVSVDEAQTVFAALPSKQKKLKIFKGGDHGIVDVPRKMREELLKKVVEWFKQTL